MPGASVLAFNSCQCCKVWVWTIGTTHIIDMLQWKASAIPIPTVNLAATVATSIHDIAAALKATSSPPGQQLLFTDSQQQTMWDFIEALNSEDTTKTNEVACPMTECKADNMLTDPLASTPNKPPAATETNTSKRVLDAPDVKEAAPVPRVEEPAPTTISDDAHPEAVLRVVPPNSIDQNATQCPNHG